MKTMKYIATVLMLLSMTSCELERLDYTEISPENFFKTETDLKLAVNSLYYDFNPGDFKAVYSADYMGYQVIGDMTTDVLWCCWAWESDELYFQQWYATVGGSIQNHAYSNFERYNFLSKARNTIRRIENSPVSEDAKTLYSGEAKALRGWMGLYLYDMFGPVPVASDEVLDDPQTFVYLPRLTEEEYDAMMEADLRDAIRDLPEVAEARGRMTKGAARMILLKYYMIKGYFDKAETLARELLEMEGRVYSLQPDYNYIFSKEGIGNNEVILQLACNNTASWYSNYMTAEVLPADYPWAEKATGWGGYVMPWDFYDTFEEGDLRLKNVVTAYTNKNGEKIDRSNSSQLAKGALPLKYGMDPDMKDGQSGILNVGGTIGLAVVLRELLGFGQIGVITMLLNVPLFVLGAKKLGRKFLFGSLSGMLLSSVFIDLFAFIPAPKTEILLDSLYGGILVGLGIGLVFLSGGSTGGSDIAARLLRRRFRSASLGKVKIGRAHV